MTYQVFGNGGREYTTNNAKSAAAIAHHYKKMNYQPGLWKVGVPEADGPVRIVEIKIESSIKKTAKAIAETKFDRT